MAGQFGPDCAKPNEPEDLSKCPDDREAELLTDKNQLLPRGLYFVATPIGSARDITLRGLDILRNADVLAAEDTRNTRHLLDIHGIALAGRKIVPYHDHNGAQQRPRLIGAIRDGQSVAYVSDAGTPLVADPGFTLAREAIAEDLNVWAAPGASALLAALVVAGLPTDKFYFAGFLPVKKAARQKALAELKSVPGSLVFFESPRRVGKTLIDMVQVLGADRQAAVCRELTKKFEQVRRGPLDELATEFSGQSPKGEIVVVVGPGTEKPIDADGLEDVLKKAISATDSLRDAVDLATELTGAPRKQLYRLALDLGKA